VIYYNNPGRTKKLRDQVLRGVLLGYEGNTICRILKPDGRITRGASIRTVEQLLWDEPRLDVQQTDGLPNRLPISIPSLSSPLPPRVKRRRLVIDN
jgi:hypothetical protein